jgi:hypothetical protein
MKKIARADVAEYGVAPKRFGVDSIFIGPNEGRSVIDNGTRPAVMLVVVNT